MQHVRKEQRNVVKMYCFKAVNFLYNWTYRWRLCVTLGMMLLKENVSGRYFCVNFCYGIPDMVKKGFKVCDRVESNKYFRTNISVRYLDKVTLLCTNDIYGRGRKLHVYIKEIGIVYGENRSFLQG